MPRGLGIARSGIVRTSGRDRGPSRADDCSRSGDTAELQKTKHTAAHPYPLVASPSLTPSDASA